MHVYWHQAMSVTAARNVKTLTETMTHDGMWNVTMMMNIADI